MILPICRVILQDAPETRLDFKVVDRDSEQTLEAILDTTASHIHTPSEEDIPSPSNTLDPWLISIADSDVLMPCSPGETTLFYTVIIPAHREGWYWGLVPERKITVEIPVEIQNSPDFSANGTTGNSQSRLTAKNDGSPIASSSLDNSAATQSPQADATLPTRVSPWHDYWNTFTPTEKFFAIELSVTALFIPLLLCPEILMLGPLCA